MKLAWCPESWLANWAEDLNKKLLNGRPSMIAHTGWTRTWTTMLQCSENGNPGASPHPNEHCKTQTGCRVPRTRFGSHIDENWVPPTERDLSLTVEKSSDPPSPTSYVS